MVRFYGTLLLFAKCPRPPCRRENSICTKIWWTIHRTNNSFWSNGLISPDFNTRSIKTSPIWQDSFTRNLSWVCIDRGGNLGRRHSGCWYWRSWKVGRIRNLSQKTECKRSPDNPQRRMHTGNRCFKNRKSQGIWSKHLIQLYHWSPWIHKTKNRVSNKKGFMKKKSREKGRILYCITI